MISQNRLERNHRLALPKSKQESKRVRKAGTACKEARDKEEGKSEAPGTDFAVYVHWPYCQSRCPYCDFNAHILPDEVDYERWQQAYFLEIERLAQLVEKKTIASVFFGGGTPSLMKPSMISSLLEKLEQVFGFQDDVEISLEANPGSSDYAKFHDFAKAGVNRISVGVQALEDQALAFLGRQHSVADSVKAIEAAQFAVPRVSLDLIYARPDQSPEEWLGELGRALDFGTEHLSLYQLTIESGTKFESMVRRGEFQIPDEARQALLFEETNAFLLEKGFLAYEVSNYARSGGMCRHNMVYWRYGSYLGIGPGAHGRCVIRGRKFATRNHRMPQIWLKKLEDTLEGIQSKFDEKTASNLKIASGEDLSRAFWGYYPLTSVQQFSEQLMMGLRLQEVLLFEKLEESDALLTTRLRHCLASSRAIKQCIEAGWLLLYEKGLVLSATGRMRLNAITSLLLEACSLDVFSGDICSGLQHEMKAGNG